MKAAGIVRRVDDLGRIAIPKQICRTLKIRECDLLLKQNYFKSPGKLICFPGLCYV